MGKPVTSTPQPGIKSADKFNLGYDIGEGLDPLHSICVRYGDAYATNQIQESDIDPYLLVENIISMVNTLVEYNYEQRRNKGSEH